MASNVMRCSGEDAGEKRFWRNGGEEATKKGVIARQFALTLRLPIVR